MNFEFTLWDFIIPLITFVLGCFFTILYDFYKERQKRKEYFFKELYEPAAQLYWKYGVLGEHEISFWSLNEKDKEKFIQIISKAKLYSNKNKELDKILEDCLYVYVAYTADSKKISEEKEEGFGESPFWNLEEYIKNRLQEKSKKYK